MQTMQNKGTLLAILIVGAVLFAGCTSNSTATPAAPTANPAAQVNKEIQISGGDYSAHGLGFHISLDETGNKVSYKDLSGNTQYLSTQENKKLLKFSITVTSLDGKQSFYSTDFLVMDDGGNTYDVQCPIDFYKNCKNQDSLDSMFDPVIGQKKTGIQIYSVPETVNHVNLVYKFSKYSDNPQILKFSYPLS
jgi:hypothetical protein